MLRSYASTLPEGIASEELSQQLQQPRDGKPLVCISVHPKQRHFAEMLRQEFEGEQYEVWLSTDCSDPQSCIKPLTASSSQDTVILTSSQKDHLEVSGQAAVLSPRCRKHSGSLTTNLQRQAFQDAADEAGVVLFLISPDFLTSQTSKEHLYYCEHRKRCVPVRGWGVDTGASSTLKFLLKDCQWEDSDAGPLFLQRLKLRLRRYLTHKVMETEEQKISEAKLDCESKSVRSMIGPRSGCVYVIGSDSVDDDPYTQELCRCIGRSLRGESGAGGNPGNGGAVTLVTGGVTGVCRMLAQSYCTTTVGAESNDNHIWHLLPKSHANERGKCRDDTSFGTIIYTGDDLSERAAIVSRSFDICILIKGDSSELVCEVEQFMFSDHIVIPINCTGSSFSGGRGDNGHSKLLDRIFQCPSCVEPQDWQTLLSCGGSGGAGGGDASPEVVSSALVRVLHNLQDMIRAAQQQVTQDPQLTPTGVGGVTAGTPPGAPAVAPPPSTQSIMRRRDTKMSRKNKMSSTHKQQQQHRDSRYGGVGATGGSKRHHVATTGGAPGTSSA